MGGCPPIWCAFTPGFIVWMIVLIDCTLKLIYYMLISVHSDRFHSPLQFFVSMKTAAFFSIALQFDRPELSNWPIGGLEIQFDKFGKIWCGRMKACDLLGWIHYKASGEWEVARTDKSYSEHILCTYLTPSPTNWALYLSRAIQILFWTILSYIQSYEIRT